MARAWWGLSLLALFGCTEGTGDSSDSIDILDGCPSGMSQASSAAITFFSFQSEGTPQQVVFDGTVTYQGRPAGCINSNGTEIDFVFVRGGQPYGRVHMRATQGGTSYDLNGSQGSIDIELFEDPAVTFSNGDWTVGSWYVSSVGAQFDSDVDGSALSAGESISVNFTVQGSP